MRRRLFLSATTATAALVMLASGSTAEAGGRDARVKSLERVPSGATLELTPKSAPYPFPEGGAAWTDSTVMVFVPAYFRLPKSKQVDFVVHFHGHNTAAKEALLKHRLREQLTASRQNAILVVPQGPWRAADGDFGKLMTKGGLGRLLDEVVELLDSRAGALGKGGVAGADGVGRVVVSAHSGGYRAAAAAAERGGVDLREIYLFDALYGEVEAFERFVATAPERHKLVSLAVGGVPFTHSVALRDALKGRGVSVASELGVERITRGDLVHARAAFLEGHGVHGAAASDESPLTECLRASCLKGRGSRDWLDHPDAPRSS